MGSFPNSLTPQLPFSRCGDCRGIEHRQRHYYPPPPSRLRGVGARDRRVTSDTPVKSVIAYPPMGDPVTMVPDTNGLYTAIEYVPPGSMPGAYEVTLVATDETGQTARKSVMVTLE
jgi:hypothetical protein